MFNENDAYVQFKLDFMRRARSGPAIAALFASQVTPETGLFELG